MKRIYIKPLFEQIPSEYDSFLCGSGGGAGEYHGGGTDGNKDNEGDKDIKGTGNDDDFDQGAKNGNFSWDY